VALLSPSAATHQPAPVPAAQAQRDQGVAAEASGLCAAARGGGVSRSEDQGALHEGERF